MPWPAIQISGPLSVAQFMRSSLVHPLAGYYMKGDVFGTQGDFTTSPEISQMFGELIGIWFINYWQTMYANSLPPFQLVELGPGRGTLMSDVLRTISNFNFISQKVEAVHLIEASPKLQLIQAETLAPGMPITRLEATETSEALASVVTAQGIKIFWHDSIKSVPEGCLTFSIAHEFFDAMPIYTFEKTEEGWREIVVDIDDTAQSSYHFRLVRAKGSTKASKAILSSQEHRLGQMQIGDRVEIAPDSIDTAQILAQRLVSDGGAALWVDYGRNHPVGDSLRGIAKHKFVSPLSMPGECDLSADVDFSALAEAARTQGAFAHGPVMQSTFLSRMGIGARLITMLRGAKTKEDREALIQEYERLISKEQMGSAYKFMAITSSDAVPYALEPEQPVNDAANERQS
eukprot:jgi/Hompol1/5668/HPOL_004636-RA